MIHINHTFSLISLKNDFLFPRPSSCVLIMLMISRLYQCPKRNIYIRYARFNPLQIPQSNRKYPLGMGKAYYSQRVVLGLFFLFRYCLNGQDYLKGVRATYMYMVLVLQLEKHIKCLYDIKISLYVVIIYIEYYLYDLRKIIIYSYNLV